MNFLTPYLKVTRRHPTKPNTVPQEETPPATTSDSPEFQQEENLDDNDIENDLSITTIKKESEDEHEIDLQELRHPRRLVVSKPRMHRGPVRYVRSKKQHVNTDLENPRRQFLLSLLPEINELSEPAFKSFKRRVLSLVDELEASTPTTSTFYTSENFEAPSTGNMDVTLEDT